MFIQRHPNLKYYLYFTDIQTDKRKKVSLKTSDTRQAKKLLVKYQTLPHLIYTELMDNSSKFLNKKYDGLALDKIKPNIVYLSSMVKRYIEHSEKNHTVKTHKAIQQTFKFFCAFIGNMDFTLLKKSSINDCIKLVENYPLDKIDKSVIEKYLEVRTDKSSIYQTRKDKINLSGFFSYLLDHNVIKEHPVQKIKIQKIPTKLPITINDNDFAILLNATSNETLKDIFSVAYYTGMRLMEIVTLKFDMLDFSERVVKLDNQTHITKSKKFRVIPMNSIVFEILTKLQSNSTTDNVFLDLLPQNDKSDFVTKQFKKIVRTTNLDKRLKFHNLRDSFATNLNIKGVSVTVIQRLLGHQNIQTTMIYTHTNNTQLKDAINVL